MKLSDYLRDRDIDTASFAEAIGVSQAAVSRYANGLRFPRPKVMERIVKATRGKVTANDFMQSHAEATAA